MACGGGDFLAEFLEQGMGFCCCSLIVLLDAPVHTNIRVETSFFETGNPSQKVVLLFLRAWMLALLE